MPRDTDGFHYTDDLLDLIDFDAEDERDEEEATDLRALVTGLPARPGTRR